MFDQSIDRDVKLSNVLIVYENNKKTSTKEFDILGRWQTLPPGYNSI